MQDCSGLLDTCQAPGPAAALLHGQGASPRPLALGEAHSANQPLPKRGMGRTDTAEVSLYWRLKDQQLAVTTLAKCEGRGRKPTVSPPDPQALSLAMTHM